MNRGLITWGIWITAAVAIGWTLHLGREILAPFALSVFVWLVMEGLARAIRRLAPVLPDWTAHAVSILLTAAAVVGFISVLAQGVRDFAAHADLYEGRINTLIADAYGLVGLKDAPSLSKLLFSDASVRFIEPILASAQGLAGDVVIVMIYVGFLYLASTTWSKKLDRIFPGEASRAKARLVGAEVRRSMEQYLWVQTVLSLITSALTYASLAVLGLDNALFWAFVIFFLNYIPTIGSIFATVLPALFALVQPVWPAWMPGDPSVNAVLVFGAVGVWQFAIGNFLQPRMMGDSLNLSAIVVLLSLAVWGALWGIPGMFLSAPLTVILMILIAQIPGARWIAVLASADGAPGLRAPLAAEENMTND